MERSTDEIAAVVEEAEAAEVLEHALFLGDHSLAQAARERMSIARDRAALARHVRLGDAIDAELRRLGVRAEDNRLAASEGWALPSVGMPDFRRVVGARASERESATQSDEVIVGPLRVRRESVSRTELEIRIVAPKEWAGHLVAVELSESVDLVPYLVGLVRDGEDAFGILHLRSRALEVPMTIGSRPLSVNELRLEHVDAIIRSLWKVSSGAAALWRGLAADRPADDPVRATIDQILGPQG